eukprot:CAMPEP_0117859272 /NCGR_PEP_ID=MMETSP0950-20121206/3031_1 /TAXON_ID=44440 /ORGANISM="Chattonella subsalsa, Strain CCMP2191" /LENGTH=133 /DNA_ID=CAMNT_0005709107 /DNA_START=411 /DNA_END=812 /DNA_ORIENTATION=-
MTYHYISTQMELARAEKEIEKEKIGMATAFQAYLKEMENIVMKNPVQKHKWMETHDGSFLNLKTGEEMCDAHPNERFVMLNQRKQQKKAEAVLEERIQAIEEYMEGVKLSWQSQQKLYLEQMKNIRDSSFQKS